MAYESSALSSCAGAGCAKRGDPTCVGDLSGYSKKGQKQTERSHVGSASFDGDSPDVPTDFKKNAPLRIRGLGNSAAAGLPMTTPVRETCAI